MENFIDKSRLFLIRLTI